MTDISPWDFQGESSPLSTTGAISTLVDGRVLALSSNNGDINGGLGPQGLFFLDSRLINRYELYINGKRVEPLGTSQTVSFAADYVGRHIDNRAIADFPLVVVRKRSLGNGMRETIEIKNFDKEQGRCDVAIIAESDFANLFAVKEGLKTAEGSSKASVKENSLWFEPTDERTIALQISSKPNPTDIKPGKMEWQAEIAAGGSWTLELEMAPWISGVKAGPLELNEKTAPKDRHDTWFKKIPKVESDNVLISRATNQSLVDLESLRIFNPTHPDRAVVAAGAPWFMTLFGRDSLITSWMAMIVDPDLAAGVLETLAQFQGKELNPDKEEAPGKIMHEVRFSGASSAALEDGDFYYGTADATPLFLMTLGELDRWGESPEVVESLMPNADLALNWISESGDVDGDGFIEYERSFSNSLFNQGWKDSGDGIRFSDGSLPEPPIALCEVQAYTYAAYQTRARLAEQQKDEKLSQKWSEKAQQIRTKFNEDFWIPEKGWFAVGLDGDKKQIDSLTSNIGHCLWTGIVDEDKAPEVAKHLMSDQMFNGWGIRTMASDTTGYNPTGYHTGSVWPHDSAIVAAGLMRYGFVEESHRIMMSLLDLSRNSSWRLPELTAGFSKDEFAKPIAYPASCSPQAWSAASTLMILRWILRIDPWCSRGRVWIDPVLPEGVERLKIDNIRLAGNRISIEVEGTDVQVTGLPPGIEWIKGLRTMSPRQSWE